MPTTTPRLTLQLGGETLAARLSRGPVTRDQACAELNMTHAQFVRSLAYIRDVLAGAEQEPVAYDPATYEYSFAGENNEATTYTTYRQKIARKQLVRLRSGTVLPAMAKFGTTEDAFTQRLARYLDNAIAELDDVIALAEANGQAA